MKRTYRLLFKPWNEERAAELAGDLATGFNFLQNSNPALLSFIPFIYSIYSIEMNKEVNKEQRNERP